MKKAIAICLTLILAVSMVGCNDKKTQDNTAPAGKTADPLADAERLEGHFVDVHRWDGAVVGTRYEDATEEIEINVKKETGKIAVELAMLYPDEFPYRSVSLYGLETYKIVDRKDRVVTKGTTTELAAYSDGKASISIPMDGLKNGDYKLMISEIVAPDSTEDPLTNPLIIEGDWVCEFTW